MILRTIHVRLLLLSFTAILLLAVLGWMPGWAQGPGGMPPALVGYTEARQHSVQRSIRLSGTVESKTISLVASEVEGLVVEFLVNEGDTVSKGQALARLRITNRELQRDAIQAQLKEANARQRQAEVNLKRAVELLEGKVIPREQYDDRLYEFNAWQGRVEQLTAEMARIHDDIARSTIHAPFAGVVTVERTEVGQWLGVGGPVAEILSMQELEVRVEVPEHDFRNLTVGAQAAVSFESLPGVEVRGRITAIIPRADLQSRTFPLKVTIPNQGGRIGVGMLAQVSFQAGESHLATVVPKDAVIRRGPQEFIYVMNGDNTAGLVPVETGQGAGSWVEVRGPVQPGQKVITRGNERLAPGQPVQGDVQEYPLP